jgi:hypothetical protein
MPTDPVCHAVGSARAPGTYTSNWGKAYFTSRVSIPILFANRSSGLLVKEKNEKDVDSI